MSDADFDRVCARTSDYCLRDIWNIRKEVPEPVDWARSPPNWNGIHALALRYLRSGNPMYLRKWQAVVGDYARWHARAAEMDRLPSRSGMPAPLLDAAFAWGGIFNALAICAKALDRPRVTSSKDSAYAPVAEPLTDVQAALIPEDFLDQLGNAFTRGAAVHMAKAYVQPKYIPNQRMFGLEALAFGCVLFPAAMRFRRTVDDGITDVAQRYKQRDGGQLEQSFNYARDLIAGLTRASNLPLSPPGPWAGLASDAALGWDRQTQALAAPGGGLPQLGNAAAGRVAIQSGLRFAATSMAFPYSGLYVQRSTWSPDAHYLFFFARRAARGHAMAGSNSVQVQAFGRWLLIAGGSADYRPTVDANRASSAYLDESSTWKTNTVLVDALSQREGSTAGLVRDSAGRPDITRVPVDPIKARWYTSNTLDYLEGVHSTGYQRAISGESKVAVDDVVHWRQVVFVRPLLLWLIVDILQTGGTHAYTQVWKLAPPTRDSGFKPDQVKAEAGLGGVVTRDSRSGAVNMALWHVAPPSLSYLIGFGSEGLGYYSAGPLREAQAAVDIHAQWKGTGPQVCVTVIAPHVGTRSNAEMSSAKHTDGIASGTVTGTDGIEVSFSASARSRHHVLAEPGVPCDLAIRLTGPGKRVERMMIGPTASYVETGGKERTTITPPSAFRWQTDASGLLIPSYH